MNYETIAKIIESIWAIIQGAAAGVTIVGVPVLVYKVCRLEKLVCVSIIKEAVAHIEIEAKEGGKNGRNKRGGG